MNRYRQTLIALAMLCCLLSLPSAAEACPNCKSGLHGNYLAIAFGASVLFMMAMPFSIAGAWVFLIVKTNRSAVATKPSELEADGGPLAYNDHIECTEQRA